MIITPPTEMLCSLESKEIKTINECITLLKDIRDIMDEYDYSCLRSRDSEEFTNGDLMDFIINLEYLKCISAMH